MAEDLPTLAAYSVALQAHREHPVRFEMRVLDLTMLVSALQLALRGGAVSGLIGSPT